MKNQDEEKGGEEGLSSLLYSLPLLHWAARIKLSKDPGTLIKYSSSSSRSPATVTAVDPPVAAEDCGQFLLSLIHI